MCKKLTKEHPPIHVKKKGLSFGKAIDTLIANEHFLGIRRQVWASDKLLAICFPDPIHSLISTPYFYIIENNMYTYLWTDVRDIFAIDWEIVEYREV